MIFGAPLNFHFGEPLSFPWVGPTSPEVPSEPLSPVADNPDPADQGYRPIAGMTSSKNFTPARAGLSPEQLRVIDSEGRLSFGLLEVAEDCARAERELMLTFAEPADERWAQILAMRGMFKRTEPLRTSIEATPDTP